jgi:hypothetical protein
MHCVIMLPCYSNISYFGLLVKNCIAFKIIVKVFTFFFLVMYCILIYRYYNVSATGDAIQIVDWFYYNLHQSQLHIIITFSRWLHRCTHKVFNSHNTCTSSHGDLAYSSVDLVPLLIFSERPAFTWKLPTMRRMSLHSLRKLHLLV